MWAGTGLVPTPHLLNMTKALLAYLQPAWSLAGRHLYPLAAEESSVTATG